ncbi:hypothetical protein JXJ21_07735 [candidate division KSB1 bacterium]|nr:hypothetical protein [candidate division KSB1 bacterium]
MTINKKLLSALALIILFQSILSFRLDFAGQTAQSDSSIFFQQAFPGQKKQPVIAIGSWANGQALVNGWMLLDPEPDAVRATIERAAEYGANHIQLSHGLIMNIDDILGDDDHSQSRVAGLNSGISLAHRHGMKSYIWAHEFSGIKKEQNPVDVCYAPDSELWQMRAKAYREGIAKIPDIDGVILMFGSAPTPPWRTFCTCDWCSTHYGDYERPVPPQSERIRMAVEHIGGCIVNDLGKELFIRTFVHEPEEIAWHNQGLTDARGVAFTGMHKGPVQDWQPYNPHHPSIGKIGEHPCILELDITGEYYGRSVLPFCAPGYYRYRLNNLWQHNGRGAVMRVQHGAVSALGTLNEVNLYAVTQLLSNQEKSLEQIWDEFLLKMYQLVPGQPGQALLKQILKDTFPIRCKSHYVLGIWAHDKHSNFPRSDRLSQFRGRGDMPKWDPDWQPVWKALDEPDRQTVIHIWQEGTEAVTLAQTDLDTLRMLQGLLADADYANLRKILLHQRYAAEVWRAIDLFIWASRAGARNPDDIDLRSWQCWAFDELRRLQNDMRKHGFSEAALASAEDIQPFLDSVREKIPQKIVPHKPKTFLFSPIQIAEVDTGSAALRFRLNQRAGVILDYGLEIPDYGETLNLGVCAANEIVSVHLMNLKPNRRYFIRLRTILEGKTYFGGDFWIFTPANAL